MTTTSQSFADVLASSLPAGLNLTFYHISTPPTSCAAIYAPPPGLKPERTYSESHSLLVTTKTSVDDGSPAEVALYAIELILYTTAHLSTLFVSKADSTGYASLISSDRAAGSVIRSITSTFVSWLIKHRLRQDRKLVLSLFARAQGQYLFPGSVENGKKHVLDDRQLVKWWCKTLDPVVREYAADAATTPDEPDFMNGNGTVSTDAVTRTKAYLIVPGHDRHETSFFFPPSSRSDPPSAKRWFNAHPLELISQHPTAPPRCLIPQFPDDPKARYLLELDEEIPDAALSQQSSRISNGKTSGKNAENTTTSPVKRGKGMWKSVRNLEQFWEMMAFRQECSSGRLVGFLWVVFTPDGMGAMQQRQEEAPEQDSQEYVGEPALLKRRSEEDNSEDTTHPQSKRRKTQPHHSKHKPKPRLTGLIHPRAPRIKATSAIAYDPPSSSPQSSFLTSITSSTSSFSTSKSTPETTKYYHAPHTSRGTLVLPQKEYDRVHEILLRLDFSSLRKSAESTGKWVKETGVVGGVGVGQDQNEGGGAAGGGGGGGGRGWGVTVVGRSSAAGGGAIAAPAAYGGPGTAGNANSGALNILSVKKRPKDTTSTSTAPAAASIPSHPQSTNTSGHEITTLNSALVRKKPKTEDAGLKQGQHSEAEAEAIPTPVVNVLAPSLVRRKPQG